MSRYIEADEVLEQIRKKLGIKSLSYLLEAERQIVDVIQSMPSIDVEPKRGYWAMEDGAWWCSACGEFAYRLASMKPLLSDFCPNCGADMKGAGNE